MGSHQQGYTRGEATAVARVREKAAAVFGDPGKALSWLESPNRALGGQKPLALLPQDAGRVEDLLDRIEHGVYS